MKSKPGKVRRFKKKIKWKLGLRAQFSLRPWKRGLEVLPEIRLSEGRITYTYSICLTWINQDRILCNISGYVCTSMKHYLFLKIIFSSQFSSHTIILGSHNTATSCFMQIKCTQMQFIGQSEIIPTWWCVVSRRTRGSRNCVNLKHGGLINTSFNLN